MDIYTVRRRGGAVLIAVAVIAVAFFIYFSSRLVSDLSAQERSRMELWADATRRLATESEAGGDVDFMLSVIEANRSIPVLVADGAGNILLHRNFDLPQEGDSLPGAALSEANESYLRARMEGMRRDGRVIEIEIADDEMQYLYYDDSRLLRNLSLYPYVQILVMAAFVLMVYFAVVSTKKAEQNKVWVGLSKETAHQLGTPISSLMAWTEYIRATGCESEAVGEMEKDVARLASIASRFSKIGSRPGLESGEVADVVGRVSDYMRRRVSDKVEWHVDGLDDMKARVPMCAPLLEWVMENLVKNAVDAMSGEGRLSIRCMDEGDGAAIEIEDTGRGIPRKAFRTVFRPGYTTRSRGWGLGLTLAKRIVEEYHGGRIFVKWSEPGVGSIFRIELPGDGKSS